MKIIAFGSITSWQKDGDKVETMSDFIFLGSKSLQRVIAATKLKDTCSLEEKYKRCIKNQRYHFTDKCPYMSKLWFFQQSCMDVRVGP